MTLVPRLVYGDLDLTDVPFSLSFGRDFGAAELSTEGLALLLQDGEIEVSPRAGNRTISFSVLIEGDLLSIAEAERALALEADKPRNTLTLSPGDDFAPDAVYETFRAQLTQEFSDDLEMNYTRIWNVEMRARPFARSAEAVESIGTSIGDVPPTVVTINAGSDVAGWYSSGGLTDQGSYLRANMVTSGGGFGTTVWRYTAASAVDLSVTSIVSLVMWNGSTSETQLPAAPRFYADGTQCPLLHVTSESGSRQRFYFQVPSNIASATTFGFASPISTSIGSVNFNSLQRTDALPPIGTTRQKLRGVEVAGSARTEGSLAVEHPSSSLGSTLIYTWPSTLSPSYSPPLRPRRVSGGTVTTDSTLISGARDLIDTAVVFDVPVADLVAGTHQLMAQLRSDTATAQTINYVAQLRIGGANVGAAVNGSYTYAFGTTNAWRTVVLGRLMLPPTDVPTGSTAVVRVTISAGNAAASNVDLDEAWLFNTTIGDLSWVECPASKRLWINSATTAAPRPTIYRGNSEDQSDAAYPGEDVRAFGAHRFSPSMMNVFTVTSGALDAAVSLTHFPHFIGHPTQ